MTIPKHVAIIMDGNGRWAKQRGHNRLKGHNAGAETVERIMKASAELGIQYLTLYAFSIENWNRPKMEVEGLMQLLHNFLKKKRNMIMKEGYRLNAIGRLDMLPEKTAKLLREVMEESAENPNGTLTFALSYGGRTEIIDAAKKIAEKVADGEISPDQIDEPLFSANLYTSNLPDPDIMIRTSGEIRLSNFLLWQLSYAEFFFTDTLWPDFSREEYEQIINTFANRDRRFGGVKNA